MKGVARLIPDQGGQPHRLALAPTEAHPSFILHDAAQSMDRIPVGVLSADRQGGRVRLHPCLDQKERVSESSCNGKMFALSTVNRVSLLQATDLQSFR
jgi:hypothetical protein